MNDEDNYNSVPLSTNLLSVKLEGNLAIGSKWLSFLELNYSGTE